MCRTAPTYLFVTPSKDTSVPDIWNSSGCRVVIRNPGFPVSVGIGGTLPLKETHMAHQFVAYLGDDVKLTAEQQREIAASVQKAVVGALARVDLRGDLSTRVPESLAGKFPDHTMGIWIERGELRQF